MQSCVSSMPRHSGEMSFSVCRGRFAFKETLFSIALFSLCSLRHGQEQERASTRAEASDLPHLTHSKLMGHAHQYRSVRSSGRSGRAVGPEEPKRRRARLANGVCLIEQQQPTRGRHTNRIFPGVYKAFPWESPPPKRRRPISRALRTPPDLGIPDRHLHVEFTAA